MTRRLLLLLATLAVALGVLGTPAGAAASSGDNIVQAINTKDGSSLFKFAFSLRKVTGEVVDNANAAIAYSSCKDCRTTAIAIQIVLVVGSPTTVTPENVALAINDQCTLCESFATAFQFVIGVEDESVGLTKQGKRELRQIIREFRALKRDDYTLEEFHAKTQALGQRLRTVLKTQLQSRRDRGHDDDDDEDDEGDQREEDERPAPPAAPPTETSTTPSTTPATTTTTGTTETTPTTTATTTEAPPPATTTEPATTTTAP
jgi:hypothetical protein